MVRRWSLPRWESQLPSTVLAGSLRNMLRSTARSPGVREYPMKQVPCRPADFAERHAVSHDLALRCRRRRVAIIELRVTTGLRVKNVEFDKHTQPVTERIL